MGLSKLHHQLHYLQFWEVHVNGKRKEKRERMERKGEKGRGMERNRGVVEEWGRKRRRGRGRKWKRCRVRTTKEAVRSADVAQRLKHSQNLPNQGELDQLMERDAAPCGQRPCRSPQICFNVSQDTLPGHTMWTCAVWKRSEGFSSHCVGEADTCAHLEPFSSGVGPQKVQCKTWCSPWSDVEAITNLPAYDYTFPACSAPTDLWPDVCAMELNPEICHSCGAASACAMKPTLKMHTSEK